MIVEFGHFALLLSVAVALYQFVVPLYGARIGEERLMRTAMPAATFNLDWFRIFPRVDLCLRDVGFQC